MENSIVQPRTFYFTINVNSRTAQTSFDLYYERSFVIDNLEIIIFRFLRDNYEKWLCQFQEGIDVCRCQPFNSWVFELG